jgi:hypothetical protein
MTFNIYDLKTTASNVDLPILPGIGHAVYYREKLMNVLGLNVSQNDTGLTVFTKSCINTAIRGSVFVSSYLPVLTNYTAIGTTIKFSRYVNGLGAITKLVYSPISYFISRKNNDQVGAQQALKMAVEGIAHAGFYYLDYRLHHECQLVLTAMGVYVASGLVWDLAQKSKTFQDFKNRVSTEFHNGVTKAISYLSSILKLRTKNLQQPEVDLEAPLMIRLPNTKGLVAESADAPVRDVTPVQHDNLEALEAVEVPVDYANEGDASVQQDGSADEEGEGVVGQLHDGAAVQAVGADYRKRSFRRRGAGFEELSKEASNFMVGTANGKVRSPSHRKSASRMQPSQVPQSPGRSLRSSGKPQ